MSLSLLYRGVIGALLVSGVHAMGPSVAFAALPGAAVVASASSATAHIGSTIYPQRGRYLLVDAASARLFMIEDGQVQDSMLVIVGKAEARTPTLVSKIYYATLNPYWNVPSDLARKLIAPRVLEEGTGYLRSNDYEVLDGLGRDARAISPTAIDWKAVADGRETVNIRQLPGPGNSMGRVKFGLTNAEGIFLHDTPKKELFAGDNRSLSNGCVRLQDAARLSRWLLGRDPVTASNQPEQHVALPQAVPVYITYLDVPSNELALSLSVANSVSH